MCNGAGGGGGGRGVTQRPKVGLARGRPGLDGWTAPHQPILRCGKNEGFCILPEALAPIPSVITKRNRAYVGKKKSVLMS